MTATRRLLLVALLVIAQILGQVALAAHGIEHAVEKSPLPHHGCSLCLAGHGLDHGVGTSTADLRLETPAYEGFVAPLARFAPAPVIRANQRAPPLPENRPL